MKPGEKGYLPEPLRLAFPLAAAFGILLTAAPEAKVLVSAPTGSADGMGTLANPITLAAALAAMAPGDTLLLRGGIYASKDQLTIARDNSGAAGRRKCVFAYPGEKPMLDFSSQVYVSNETNPRGVQLNGSYWHFRGLEVKGSADNGFFVAGNHNIVESCVFHRNRDSGLQISRWDSKAPREEWPSHNLILNCESYDNFDAPPGSGENADGFACKLTSGEGNVFRGCVAHHNIDDGWDLFTKTATGPIGVVVIDRCIAYANGSLTDGVSHGNGDRNGFKLGGEKIEVAHIVTRSVAFGNGKHGFHFNSNPGAIRLSNNLAFDNAQGNFRFGGNGVVTKAIFTNNVSFSSPEDDKCHGVDISNSNCWWDPSLSQPTVNGKGLLVTGADFAMPLLSSKNTWNADGSPDFSLFRLAPGSDLANAGVVPGGSLPFEPAQNYKGLPDLGAVEIGGGATAAWFAPARPVSRAQAPGAIPGLFPYRGARGMKALSDAAGRLRPGAQ